MDVVKNEKAPSEATMYDVWYYDGMTMYRCGSCHDYVDGGDNYCRRCGAKFVNKKLININDFHKIIKNKRIGVENVS